MQVEAKMNRTWAVKWVILALFMVGYGGLCVNDALVVYPEDDARFEAYEELDRKGEKSRWPEVAAEHGWSDEQPKTKHDAYDIQTQWYQLAFVWPVGFGALMMVLWTSRQKLLADDEGFVAANGKRIGYGDITGIRYDRWNSKGIALVVFQDENGEESEAKIDDWVFEGGEDVLRLIEEQTGISQDATGE